MPVNIEWRPFVAQLKLMALDVRRMANALEKTKVPLERAVDRIVIDSIRLNFGLQGRPKWRPLAESTVRLRGTSRPILIHTTKLFRNATSKTIWSIDNSQANMKRLGNLVRYAGFHQTGTRFMPMREFAALQLKDINDIEDIFDKWIHEVTVTEGRWPP